MLQMKDNMLYCITKSENHTDFLNEPGPAYLGHTAPSYGTSTNNSQNFIRLFKRFACRKYIYLFPSFTIMSYPYIIAFEVVHGKMFGSQSIFVTKLKD